MPGDWGMGSITTGSVCGTQSNIYPADAAAAWPAIEEAAARMGGLRIGAPSAAGCGGGPLCAALPDPYLDPSQNPQSVPDLDLNPNLVTSFPVGLGSETIHHPALHTIHGACVSLQMAAGLVALVQLYPHQLAGQLICDDVSEPDMHAIAIATSEPGQGSVKQLTQCGGGRQVHAWVPQPLRLAGRFLRQLQRLSGFATYC